MTDTNSTPPNLNPARGGVYLRALLACVLLLSTILTALAPAIAYAGESVNVSVGSNIPYAGYSTHWMYADGEIAICAQPTANTPSSGTYQKQTLNATSGRTWEVAADLWFSYGAPGFDASMWPSTWYDGTEMNAGRYLALSHILISDSYSSDGNYAMAGCNEDFKEWCKQYIIGINSNGDVTNENATGRLMFARGGEVPSNFETYQIPTGAGTQVLVSFKYTPYGSIGIQKGSAVEATTNDNSVYAVEGAVYGIYSDEGCTAEIARITTDGNGYNKVDNLEAGKTFYIKEISAPAGMTLDTTVYPATVVSNETVTVDVSDAPKSAALGIIAKKYDTETSSNTPQGDATLAGAEFTVKYFDNTEGLSEGEATHTWKFKTDSAGEIWLNDGAGNYYVGGDALYTTTDGRYTFPLGTYTIEETTAPEGYLLDSTVHTAVVTEDNAYTDSTETAATFTVVSSTCTTSDGTPLAYDDVIRGGVMVTKSDLEIGKSEAIGGADHTSSVGANLNGIEFTIQNASAHKVLVNGTWYEPGQDVATITTSYNEELAAYTAQTAADTLPYGTYTVRETATNDSYLLTDGEPKTFEIREDGMTVVGTVEGDELTFYDQVVRNDLEITKKADDTNRSLQVPFAITNVTTGETHVIVTDRNGDVSTASSWNLHSNNTNANDALLALDYITAADMDTRAGVWFGLAEDGSVAPVNDALGALPYGEYQLTELRCEANEGYDLITKTFWIERDSSSSRAVWMSLDDQPAPSIGTTAASENGTHYAQASAYTTITDTVYYENLETNMEYTLTATLMDATTGTAILDSEGSPVTATSIFAPKSNSGTTEIALTFDASELAGHDVVVFESLVKDGIEIASHKDITDADQTIRIIDISTTAQNAANGTDYVSGNCTIVDSVSYTGLTPGVEYTVAGTLMDTNTGEPALTAEGELIVSTVTFTPSTSNGTVDVEFEIDASDFVGTDLVVFECLMYGQTIIATHADITDEDQTVHPVEIGTTFLNPETGNHYAQAADAIELVDTVSYAGLIPGQEYKITGTLMVKSTGEALLDEDDNPTTTTVAFIPEASEGSVDITFSVDAQFLTGESLVAFEELSINGTVIAEHKDINDPAQTVTIVDIATELTDENYEHTVSAGDITLIDLVDYMGLIPGETYQMVGTLMNKATGEALTYEDGRAVCAETTFVPEDYEGTVAVEFELNTSNLPDGFEIVAFEQCLDIDGNIVATHEDINDELQTVTINNPGEEPTEHTPTVTRTTGKTYAKTGIDLGILQAAIAALALAGATCGGVCAYKLKVKKNSEPNIKDEA